MDTEELIRRSRAASDGIHTNLNGAKPGGKNGSTPHADGSAPGELPVIDIADQDLKRSSKACWDALERANNPPRLFVYAGIPTRIDHDEKTGAPKLQHLDVNRLRNHAARAATFVRTTARGERASARPPEAVIKDMLAEPSFPLPRLEAVVEIPTFAENGRLSTGSGYHSASQTYYVPGNGLTIPSIPDAPSDYEIAAARTLIQRDLFGDFPFTQTADLAHAIAMLLLPSARNLIDGATPMHLLEKPMPGTGATLLVDSIAMVNTGRAAAAMTEGRDEDDMRKRLTAVLLNSPTLVFFDNLRRPLDYSCLAAMITETRWKDRLLGTSSMAEVPVKCVWCATGNNPVLSSEMTRRTVSIRLDAKDAQPWLRSGFRHANLRAWVKSHRADLIAACLTLIQAWIARGRPAPSQLVALGMFEEWSAVMGGILECAGIEGFLANRQDFYARSDKEGDSIRGFLAAWWDAHGTTKVKVSTLFVIATAPDSTIDISAKTEQGQRVRLGALLATIEGRHYRLDERLTVRVVRTGEKEKGAVLWQLNSGESWSQNGESSDQDSPQDSPHEKPHNDAEDGPTDTPSGESGESVSNTQHVVDENEEEKTTTGPGETDSPDSPEAGDDPWTQAGWR
jgi:putative DNA primase/helicase